MLLETLIERQRRLGLNDTEFAARIGISFSTWRLTKLRHKKIGMRIVRGVLASDPDLRPEVLLFLSQPSTKVEDSQTESTNAGEREAVTA